MPDVRSPREVYDAHVAALAGGDLDAVVADYDEDAVLASNDGIGRGRDYVREVFAQFLGGETSIQPRTEVRVEGDVVHVTWTASSSGASLAGADTFVARDGLIVVHTGFFTQTAGS